MSVVISVDLACKRSCDIGIVVIERQRARVRARPVHSMKSNAPPTPSQVAEVLIDLARAEGAHVLVLDGPQAWKSPDNGCEHARSSEAQLATPAKTGLPGQSKPGTYLRFIQFSISVFDELGSRGWSRLETPHRQTPLTNLALESFPTAAWRAFGLSPLPGKASCKATDVARKQSELENFLGVRVGTRLTHDELQALIAGFGGLAVDAMAHHAYKSFGVPPLLLDGTWREGFIVNPTRSKARSR